MAPKEKRRHNLGFLSPSNARANPIPSASTARSLGPHARRERSSEWGCNRFAPRSGAELCARIATNVAIAQKARAPAMTRASSFQRAPAAGKGRCGRSVGILLPALPQAPGRPVRPRVRYLPNARIGRQPTTETSTRSPVLELRQRPCEKRPRNGGIYVPL